MPHSAWLHSATKPSGSASGQDLVSCGSPSFGSPWPDDGSARGTAAGQFLVRLSRNWQLTDLNTPADVVAAQAGSAGPRVASARGRHVGSRVTPRCRSERAD